MMVQIMNKKITMKQILEAYIPKENKSFWEHYKTTKGKVIFTCPNKITDDALEVLVDQQVDALLKSF